MTARAKAVAGLVGTSAVGYLSYTFYNYVISISSTLPDSQFRLERFGNPGTKKTKPTLSQLGELKMRTKLCRLIRNAILYSKST